MSTYTQYHKEYYEKKKDLFDRERALQLVLYNNAHSRAIRKGYEFNLEHSDIIIPKECPYLKVPLTSKFDKGIGQHQENKATLDRIDSTKGYIKGNIEVISLKANQMKSDATKTQLIQFAKSVLAREGTSIWRNL
jgi:hypothetical protein